MEIIKKIKKSLNLKLSDNSGFALLLTLVVISVVLAIGLSMLHITMKQLTLSNVSRDSEISLHAARSGIECMQYHRSDPTTLADMLNGGSAPALTCGGSNYMTIADGGDYRRSPGTNHSGNTYNYYYTYQIGSDLCVETSIYLLDARGLAIGSSDITRNTDEGLDQLTCSAGVLCTTIFSRGFNRSCNERDSFLTVQRELTIQF